ncbi:hypothetical protein J3492_04400 [Psychrobacter sp. F1192]|uniref:Lipoprotein n=2 Tax=Psychrobacter coccoides TaxID=2818440 RepID=A0ABS3NM21_9GAMM|nr:hypothetical protein [Psychrobacter coccoides]
MWNNTLQTFVISIMTAVGLSLSACNGAQQDIEPDTSSDDTTATETVQSSPTPEQDMDGATVAQSSPVKYDVASWDSSSERSVSINELDKIQAVYGKVVNSDENSLDYASNPATKYRFMDTDAPYLDLIDSEKYLELGWYYANPTDSDAEKALSKAHAKKSHQLAQQLMGADGAKVVTEMLNGQIIKNKTIGGQKIELAKCEFYSCMLVFNKSGEQQVDAS